MAERDFSELFAEYSAMLPRSRLFSTSQLTPEQERKAAALMEDYIAGTRSKPVSNKEVGQPDIAELIRLEKERGIRILI